MDFNLSKEQELLRDGLTKFLATRYDLAKSRTAAHTGAGWQPEIWRGFAEELGILGATFPEEIGGIGGGPTELMVITEALGHALAIEPYVGTVVVAGGLLSRAGGESADALLTAIAEGSAVVALASGTDLRATPDGQHWVLSGSADVVADAPLASHLLIAAHTADGISLFCTEFDASDAPNGLTVHPYRTIDDRRAADLVFDGVRLGAPLLVDVGPALDRARDEAAAAVCSEAVGCMRKVLADTVEYCRQRQQFGQPIGSFQVLQHRMVDMYLVNVRGIDLLRGGWLAAAPFVAILVFCPLGGWTTDRLVSTLGLTKARMIVGMIGMGLAGGLIAVGAWADSQAANCRQGTTTRGCNEAAPSAAFCSREQSTHNRATTRPIRADR